MRLDYRSGIGGLVGSICGRGTVLNEGASGLSDQPAGTKPTVVPTIRMDLVPPKSTGSFLEFGSVAFGGDWSSSGIVSEGVVCSGKELEVVIENGQSELVRHPMNIATRKTELASVAIFNVAFALAIQTS